MATVLRGPLFTRQPPAKPRPLDVIPNLLLTTLAVAAVAVPFAQTDWSAPKTLPLVPQFQPPNLTLSLPVAPPFQQTNWPAAQQRIAQPQFTQPNITIRFDTQGPFTPSLWQTPAAVLRTPQFQPQNLLGTTLAQTAAPFTPLDWRLPIQPQRVVTTDPVNLLNTALAPVGQAPFANPIWYAPAAVVKAPVFDPPNVTAYLPVASPFAQYQWPLPIPGPRIVVIDVPNVTVNLPPGPEPVPDVSPSTPGRVIRAGWLSGKAERQSVDVGVDITKPSITVDIDKNADEKAILAESARVDRKISKIRTESAALRAEIARLDADVSVDGIRTIAEQNARERALMEAQQQAVLLAVQEAVLMEEMEVIDIAFVALTVTRYME